MPHGQIATPAAHEHFGRFLTQRYSSWAKTSLSPLWPVVELHLLREGLVGHTPCGQIATPAAHEHLGLFSIRFYGLGKTESVHVLAGFAQGADQVKRDKCQVSGMGNWDM